MMHSENFTTRTEMAAIEVLSGQPILGNAYFQALSDGRMSKGDFLESQTQFYHAVGYFSRCLASLAARLPTSAGRAVLIHNLSEEHGFDEAHPEQGFRAGCAHDQTFARFLASLEPDAETLPASRASAPVKAFNLALQGACSSESPAFAFAALGLIEYAFADISALIGRRVVDLGWVKPGELVHYCVHEEIDKRHAAELFEAAEEAESPEESSASISDGLAFGHYLFDRLYKDLLPARP